MNCLAKAHLLNHNKYCPDYQPVKKVLRSSVFVFFFHGEEQSKFYRKINKKACSTEKFYLTLQTKQIIPKKQRLRKCIHAGICEVAAPAMGDTTHTPLLFYSHMDWWKKLHHDNYHILIS
ncbi:UNVERIFIED_CONTAM: hypothetical protein NY100_02985 [Prevotella sp. 15_C9]